MKGAELTRTYIRPAVVLLALFTLLTGLVYPLAVTGLAQAVFPIQANGSLMAHNDRIVGSALIGQPFDDPRYFWGRPSATAPFPYNAAASSGSNFGPSNPALIAAVQKIEHHEIVCHGCLHEWAGLLGNPQAARLLHEILAEEKAANERLTEPARASSNQASRHDFIVNEIIAAV